MAAENAEEKMTPSDAYLEHVRALLRRSVMLLQAIAIGAWTVTILMNRAIEQPTVRYVLIGLPLLIGVCVWKSLATSLLWWRMGTIAYGLFLAMAFRLELALMGSQGTLFSIPLAILLSVGFAGVVPLRRDYALTTTIIWASLIVGPQKLPHEIDLLLAGTLIGAAMVVGLLLNNLIIRNLRRTFELKEEFETLAQRDALTGILNRRSMIHQLEQCRLHHPDSACALVLLDLDNFKLINDRLGHAAGDAVLKHLADAMKCLPGETTVGRWGGEEFVIIFHLKTRDEVNELIKNLQFSIRTASGAVPAFSFSAGAVLISKRAPVDDLLQKADEALYAAKNNGKARMEWQLDRRPLTADSDQIRNVGLLRRKDFRKRWLSK